MQHLPDASTAVDHPPCCAVADGARCAVAAGSEATINASPHRSRTRPTPSRSAHTAALTTTFTNTGPVTCTTSSCALSMPDGSFVHVDPPTASACSSTATRSSATSASSVPAGEIDLTVLEHGDRRSPARSRPADGDAEHADPQFPTASLDVVARVARPTSEWALPAGDTVTTDPGTGATTQNPQVTTAEVPATDIAERRRSCPRRMPHPASSARRCGDVLRSDLDDHHRPDVLARRSAAVRVRPRQVRDPEGHQDREDPDVPRQRRRRELHRLFGTASPDPCVVSRKKLKKTGDVEIVVLSSTNGRWRP